MKSVLVALAVLSLVVAGCADDAEVSPDDPMPCPTDGSPIGKDRALDTLRRHGFSVRGEAGPCEAGVGVAISNAHREGVLEREGIVHCFLYEKPREGAPKTVVRRGVDGGDAELVLQNLRCAILADSPRAEEKIDPLEAAFAELERAIRP